MRDSALRHLAWSLASSAAAAAIYSAAAEKSVQTHELQLSRDSLALLLWSLCLFAHQTMEERRTKLARMFNEHAPIGKTIGARLYYRGDIAVVEMPYSPAFDTAGGNVHGGIGALLLDTAMVQNR